MLRKMQFVTMWVQKDHSIKVDAPDNLKEYININKLNLL